MHHEQISADVQRLVQRLGPVKLATRLSPATGWTPSPATNLDLAELGVALALGEPSAGLCGLQFTRGNGLDGFLAANPALHPTLRVEQAGTITLLLRVDGPLPSSRSGEDVAWLSTGSFLPVIRRQPTPWHGLAGCVTPNPAPAVKLAELDWRPLGSLGRSLLRDALLPQHGPVFASPVAARGRLNLRFWSAYLLADLRLRFHARRGVFEQHDTGVGAWVERVQPVVQQLADQAVHQATAEWGSAHQPRPVELRRLVAQMKLAGTVDVPDAREFFRQCLVEGLVRQSGASVTGAEVLGMVARRHQQDERPMPSRSLAGRWINALVFEIFSAPQHRNLKPDRKWARGFRGLCLREDGVSTADSEPSEGKAGREQTGADGLVSNKEAITATDGLSG